MLSCRLLKTQASDITRSTEEDQLKNAPPNPRRKLTEPTPGVGWTRGGRRGVTTTNKHATHDQDRTRKRKGHHTRPTTTDTYSCSQCTNCKCCHPQGAINSTVDGKTQDLGKHCYCTDAAMALLLRIMTHRRSHSPLTDQKQSFAPFQSHGHGHRHPQCVPKAQANPSAVGKRAHRTADSPTHRESSPPASEAAKQNQSRKQQRHGIHTNCDQMITQSHPRGKTIPEAAEGFRKRSNFGEFFKCH